MSASLLEPLTDHEMHSEMTALTSNVAFRDNEELRGPDFETGECKH